MRSPIRQSPRTRAPAAGMSHPPARLRPMTADMGKVNRLTRRQRSLISRTQALAAGLTDAQIKALLQQRIWVLIRPGVYAVAGAAPSWEQAVLAVLLSAGEGAFRATPHHRIPLRDAESRTAKFDRGRHHARPQGHSRRGRRPPLARTLRCRPHREGGDPDGHGRSGAGRHRRQLPPRRSRQGARRPPAATPVHARRGAALRQPSPSRSWPIASRDARRAGRAVGGIRPRRQRSRDPRAPSDRKGWAPAPQAAAPHAPRWTPSTHRPRLSRAQDRHRGRFVGVPRKGSVGVRRRPHPTRRARPSPMDAVHVHACHVKRLPRGAARAP